MSTWVHLHLPRLLAFRQGRGGCEVLSIKTPGVPMEYGYQIALKDVSFRVHEQGRQRTLATGQRNVHAWVVGERMKRKPAGFFGWKRAIYDPRKGDSFVDAETLQPLTTAARAVLSEDKVFYR